MEEVFIEPQPFPLLENPKVLVITYKEPKFELWKLLLANCCLWL